MGSLEYFPNLANFAYDPPQSTIITLTVGVSDFEWPQSHPLLELAHGNKLLAAQT